MDFSKEFFDLKLVKIDFMAYIYMLKADVWKEKIMEDLQLKNIIELNFIKYLINFIDYFFRYIHILPKQMVNYFKAYLDIIDTAVDRAKYKKSSKVNEKKEP